MMIRVTTLDDAGVMDDSTDEDTDEDTDNDTDDDVDDHTSHYPRFFTKARSKLCRRLKGVKLRIKDRGLERGDSISGASPQWLKLVNKFSNLKSLALHSHADKLSLDNVRGRPRGSIEYWFSVLSLRHLKFLSLARWVLCSIGVKSMHRDLPRLRELHVENVALVTYPGNTFAEIAVSLRNYYKGNCTLSFGDGSFFEVTGLSYDDHHQYSENLEPVSIATLEIALMRLLEAVSRETWSTSDTEKKMRELIQHQRPSIQQIRSSTKWKAVKTKKCRRG
jgi:hypothetical protein